jgi:hypothetical protein
MSQTQSFAEPGPRTWGRRPTRIRHAVWCALALCASQWGCASDEEQVIPPSVLGLQETAAPIYDDGQVQIFQVQNPVTLPMRRPTSEERPRGASPPFPRPPFHLASDTRVTVRFTLTNLEAKQNVVELLLDPWNEFVRYRPGVATAGEDETIPNFSGIDRFFVLPPLARIEGIITPDDMVEMAVDLATAQVIASRPPDPMSAFGGPALYNRAFNIQNRSSEPDLVLGPYLPPVVPGLMGFDLGLRSYAPAKVAVELVIDVEDLHGDRVIPEDKQQEERPVGAPGQVLTPPAAAGP